MLKFRSRKSKKPRSAHTGRGFVFFPNSLTASGVRTGTNNNAAGNDGLEHDAAKVETQVRFGLIRAARFFGKFTLHLLDILDRNR